MANKKSHRNSPLKTEPFLTNQQTNKIQFVKIRNSTQEVMRDMDKYAGIHSEIRDCGGVPTLYINGEAHAAVAYMTYLEKFNKYDDFAEVYQNYKAVILLSGAKTAYMEKARKLCETNSVPYIMSSPLKEKFTVNELRAFCKANGVHIYCETDDIIYVNENYICIYAVTDGAKALDLGKERNICELLGSTYQGTADSFTFEMQKGETRLFRLD